MVALEEGTTDVRLMGVVERDVPIVNCIFALSGWRAAVWGLFLFNFPAMQLCWVRGSFLRYSVCTVADLAIAVGRSVAIWGEEGLLVSFRIGALILFP